MNNKTNIFELIILLILAGVVSSVYFINKNYSDIYNENEKTSQEISDIDKEIKNHPNYKKISLYGDSVYVANNLSLYKDKLAYADEYIDELKNHLTKDMVKSSVSKLSYNVLFDTFTLSLISDNQVGLMEDIKELNKFQGFSSVVYSDISVKPLKTGKTTISYYATDLTLVVSKDYLNAKFKEKTQQVSGDLNDSNTQTGDIINNN